VNFWGTSPVTVAINERVQYYFMLFGFAVAIFGFASATYSLVMFPRVYELPVAMQINTFALPTMILILAGDIWVTRRRGIRRELRSMPARLLLFASVACFAAVTVGSALKWSVVATWGPALMLAGCLCLGGQTWLHLRLGVGADAHRRDAT
jgi:hypothetical protein